MRALMKRVFSNPLVALIAGLCLRVYFVLKFPASSGDTVLYEQIATNWLKHHIYGMDVGGAIIPVDLRMPGYPAFLATMYTLTGRTGADGGLWVMLAQIGVDLLSCLIIARLAALLACTSENTAANTRVYSVALWLAVLCPFTANYTAVPLTEVFAGFFTAAAFVSLIVLIWDACGGGASLFRAGRFARHAESIFALTSGFLIGMATLFRPESPLLLVVAWFVVCFIWLRKQRFLFCLQLLV